MNRKPVINYALVADGLLFVAPGDRCRYLGKSRREKLRWLEENKGRYRRLDNVLQGRPDNVGVAATGVRKDGDDDDALINPPPEDSSPPYQPSSLAEPVNESVPEPVNESVLNESTRTELPRAKAAPSETKEPKQETTPVATTGRLRGGHGSRQVKKQKTPARTAKSALKVSPELVRVVVDALSECPILSYAAHKAGIHRKKLEYRINCSKAGHPGYDVEWQGYTFRFHELCQSACDEAYDKLREVVWKLALGVTFKIDPFLADLGCEGVDAYAQDENGRFIVETVGPPRPKWIRFYLEFFCPDKWGKNRKSDVPRTSGLLMIGDIPKKPEYNTAASVKARKWKGAWRRLRKS